MSSQLASNEIKQDRLVLLDACRVIAAIAIIWLHTAGIAKHNPPEFDLWYRDSFTRFAVPFFTFTAMIMLWKSMSKKRDISFPKYAINRVKRIYIPFFVWSLIYFIFINAKHLLHGNPPTDIGFGLLIAGTAHHLWFLPFIFYASLLGFWAIKAILYIKVTWIRWFLACLLIISGVIVGIWGTSTVDSWWLNLKQVYDEKTLFGLFYLIALSTQTLPSLLWAFAIILICPQLISLAQKHRFLPILSLLIWLFSSIFLHFRRDSSLVENIAGVMFGIMALSSYSSLVIQWLARWGKYSLGIYLLHILFVLGFEMVLVKDRTTLELGKTLFIFVTATISCTLAAWALSKSKYTAWMVP